MADETEDISNVEQVSVCAQFVHNYEVYEEFLGFVRWMPRLHCFLHLSSGELIWWSRL